MIEDGELQTVKNTKDTISFLNHMLDSARERVQAQTIDSDYRDLLQKRIPELERKILVLEQSLN